MGRQTNHEIADGGEMTDVAVAAAVHLVVDNEVWVADAAKSWVCGKVTATDGDSVTVRVKDEKEDRRMKVTDVHRANAKMQGGAEVTRLWLGPLPCPPWPRHCSVVSVGALCF